MTRKEEIKEASINYQLATRPMAIGGAAFADEVREMNANPTFINAAEWADKTMIEKVSKWIDDNLERYIFEGRNGKTVHQRGVNGRFKAGDAQLNERKTMAHYKLTADLATATGDIYDGFANNPFNGVFGKIEDENGCVLGKHFSSTLQWLEHDLLGHVPFDPQNDSYEKNW